jgi:hypothetical protein
MNLQQPERSSLPTTFGQEPQSPTFSGQVMSGATDDMLAKTRAQVQGEQDFQDKKRQYEELLLQGEKGVDAFVQDAVKLYGDDKDESGQPKVLRYIPPKAPFVDPQTGVFDPANYYEKAHVGIMKYEENVRTEKEKEAERASKEKIAGMGVTGRKDVATAQIEGRAATTTQTNQTRLAIAAMRLPLDKERLEIMRMDKGEAQRTRYLDLLGKYTSLLLKANENKSKDASNVMLSPEDQKQSQDDIDSITQSIDDVSKELVPAAQTSGELPKPKKGPKSAKKEKFVVGKTYKDASGKTAKYLGNGKWQE